MKTVTATQVRCLQRLSRGSSGPDRASGVTLPTVRRLADLGLARIFWETYTHHRRIAFGRIRAGSVEYSDWRAEITAEGVSALEGM